MMMMMMTVFSVTFNLSVFVCTHRLLQEASSHIHTRFPTLIMTSPTLILEQILILIHGCVFQLTRHMVDSSRSSCQFVRSTLVSLKHDGTDETGNTDGAAIVGTDGTVRIAIDV